MVYNAETFLIAYIHSEVLQHTRFGLLKRKLTRRSVNARCITISRTYGNYYTTKPYRKNSDHSDKLHKQIRDWIRRYNVQTY